MNIEKLTTGAPGQPDFTNNAWTVGDDREVTVIDPAHQPDRIALAIGDWEVKAVLLTHGHWGHVMAAPAFVALVGDPPVHLNPADEFLWREAHPHKTFRPIADGDEFTIAEVTLRAVVTPGRILGMTCFVTDGVVFTGNILFEGGPGTIRWDYSDFGRIIALIRERLFILPDNTVVNTGHGPSTTIGKEHPYLDERIARGW